MKKFPGFLIPLLLTLTGCLFGGSYEENLNKYAAQYATEVELSQKYLSQLRAHDFTDIEQHVDASLKSGSLHDNLEKLASYIPSGDPTDVKLIGVYRNEISNAENMSTTQVDYEYNFAGKWRQGDVILKGEKPNLSILRLSVTDLVGPLEEINKFTLQGKRFIDYVVLAVTCLIPIFIVFALVVCIRTPIRRIKWLWIIFIIFGVIDGTLDWTNGDISFNPFSLRFFGAGFYSGSPYSPVYLLFSFPLGAIIFLLARKRWIAKSTPLASSGSPA